MERRGKVKLAQMAQVSPLGFTCQSLLARGPAAPLGLGGPSLVPPGAG